MKLKNKDVADIAQALKLLDGNEKREYKFTTKTRMNIARKLRIAVAHAEDMEKVRTDLIKTHKLGKIKQDKDGKDVGADTQAELQEYNDAWREFMRQESEIEIGKFLLKDLDLETNSAMPPTMIAALLPIITEDEPATK